MTTPGGINNSVPPAPGEIMRRMQALERRVKMLEGARRLENSAIGAGSLSIDAGGDITLNGGELATRGGVIHAYNAAGQEIFAAGTANGATGVAMIREDGTTVMSFIGGPWRLYDHAGHVVMADDYNGGVGLANPYLHMGALTDTNVATWPSTTNGAWAGIAEGFIAQQNPGFSWQFFCYAETGTTGNLRLTINGTEIARTPDVTAGFYQWGGTYYYPAGWTYGATVVLALEAIRTAGTGAVKGQQLYLQGAQSP